MEKIQFNEQKFQKALDVFKDYSKEIRFKEDIEEREARKNFFQRIIKEKFSELVFSEAIKKLWAAEIWSNKDYLVNKIIRDNGIEKLNNEFSYLTSNKGTIGERYERFLENVKGMGPSMITEILCYLNPQNAGIWNDKARKVLEWLGVESVSYDKYKIDGKEYDEFNKLLKIFSQKLFEQGYKEKDFLFVDYFLWEIWDKFIHGHRPEETIIKKGKGILSKHDELRDKIETIGSWLGFETEKEKWIAEGAKLDVVWKARIANLGVVSYVFEVQDRGSIDSLILNLQRSQKNPTVQKIIAVSDSDQLEKIKKEISTMPENFRKAVAFWEVEDVESTYQSLEQVTSSIAKLNLVEE